jgi:membrane protein DedA with SNARE-associated domain
MNFTQIIATYGSWAVLVVVAIQCAGIPVPGGAVLLAAAIYAGVTHKLDLAPIIVAAAVGAVLGSMIGFWLGSSQGYQILLRYGHFLRLNERKLKLGQYLFLKHGGAIVVLGRFLSVSRTLSGLLAGINKMGWFRFLLFSVVGSVMWATVVGLGSYYLGDSFHRPTGPLGIALLVLVLCLFILCIFFLLRNMRRFEDEAALTYPDPLGMYSGESKCDEKQSQQKL